MKDSRILTLPHFIMHYYFAQIVTVFNEIIISLLPVSHFLPNHVLWNVRVFLNVVILICSMHMPYHRIFWRQSISSEFRALINNYFKMPSNKITKRIKNAWTEDDMQSALALVNSTTQSIRPIAKVVRFLIYQFKELQKVQQYVHKS